MTVLVLGRTPESRAAAQPPRVPEVAPAPVNS